MLRGSCLLLAALCAAAGTALAAPGGALAGTWCGNDVAEANRVPEAVSGHQIHVVYAYPADAPDRFAERASPIVSDLEAIDAWWRTQDPTRSLRFDEFAFPGCAPGLTRLDLSKVRLPNPGAHYAERTTILSRLLLDLGSNPFRFTHRWAKYLVYYDGPTSHENTCGVGHTPSSLTVPGTIAAVFLQSCGGELDDLGAGGFRAWTAAHEIVHNLGAVQRSAPNACPESGHTCDHDQDLMGRFVNAPIGSAVLDFNHDDWYGHGGGWADVQDSPWLWHLGVQRPQVTVALAGAAGGTRVESELPGIACPPQCAIDWDPGTEVRVAAVPARGQRLVRWQGDCTNREELCVLSVHAARSVTAVFGPSDYRLALSVAGGGTIRTSIGTACARSCSRKVAADEVVSLRAQPRKGYRFVRWSGACRGTKLRCTVKLSANRAARAHFARRR